MVREYHQPTPSGVQLVYYTYRHLCHFSARATFKYYPPYGSDHYGIYNIYILNYYYLAILLYMLQLHQSNILKLHVDVTILWIYTYAHNYITIAWMYTQKSITGLLVYMIFGYHIYHLWPGYHCTCIYVIRVALYLVRTTL